MYERYVACNHLQSYLYMLWGLISNKKIHFASFMQKKKKKGFVKKN